MKIFLSWSKDESRQYASIFKEELSVLFEKSDIFMSEEDISMGSFSIDTIMENLSNSDYGILFVTPSNQNEPWLNFEAGALSKGVPNNYVTPIGFRGMQIGALNSPIKAYQGFTFGEKKFKKTMREINNLSDDSMGDEAFERLLNMSWTKINEEVLKVSSSFGQETEKELEPIDGKLNLILNELSKLRQKMDNKKNHYYFYNPKRIKDMLPKFDIFIQENDNLIKSNRFPFVKTGKKGSPEDISYFSKYIRKNFVLPIDGPESTIYVSHIISIFYTYYVLREQEIDNLIPDENDNLIQ